MTERNKDERSGLADIISHQDKRIAELEAVVAALTPSWTDACVVSIAFHDKHDLRREGDRRVNEWLKRVLSIAKATGEGGGA